jgi:molybdopterin converting factor small subunit
MNDKMMSIHIEIRGKDDRKNFLIDFPEESLRLVDVFRSIFSEEWGNELIEDHEGTLKVRTGFMFVVNTRMIQEWDVEMINVKDGDELKFIPVVPGG